MAIDLTKARKLATGDIITPKGRMMWPALFKPNMPKGETNEAKLQYQCSLLLPVGADLKVLADAVAETIAGKWGADAAKKFKIKKPFKKVSEEPKLAELADAYPMILRAWSKDRPKVVYANVKECTDESDVYGGRWACLLIRPFTFDHPTGGKGVSFGLQHVQILDPDEPIGGARVRAEDAFEAIPDAGATADAPQTADQLWS